MKNVLSYEIGKIDSLVKCYESVEKFNSNIGNLKFFLLNALKIDICLSICRITEGNTKVEVCGKEVLSAKILGDINQLLDDHDYIKIKKLRNTTLAHNQKNRFSESELDGKEWIHTDYADWQAVTLDIMRKVTRKLVEIFSSLTLENGNCMTMTYGIPHPICLYDLEIALKKAALLDRLIETKFIEYKFKEWPLPERCGQTEDNMKKIEPNDIFTK